MTEVATTKPSSKLLTVAQKYKAQRAEMEAHIAEFKRKGNTTLLKAFKKNMNKADMELFDMLPLSDYEKEKMITEMLLEDEVPTPESIKDELEKKELESKAL